MMPPGELRRFDRSLFTQPRRRGILGSPYPASCMDRPSEPRDGRAADGREVERLQRDLLRVFGKSSCTIPAETYLERLTMARLIYSSITSLDGYVADEDGNLDW